MRTTAAFGRYLDDLATQLRHEVQAVEDRRLTSEASS
jgi:hypothetical protein